MLMLGLDDEEPFVDIFCAASQLFMIGSDVVNPLVVLRDGSDTCPREDR